MRGQRIFPAIVLIGFGLYSVLQDFITSSTIFNWPTLLIIIGVAFFTQAYVGKEYGFILPAVLFIGIGIHFHLVSLIDVQLDHFGVILLFTALGFFLLRQKTGSGTMYAWLFLFLALFQLFSTNLFHWFGSVEQKLIDFYALWPILMILFGFYLFLFKRN
ncbi:hypothetical protein [Fervidibacillus albus]|uniref:DUF5668 domain-containing protein n=1 Tax=Fervidibacillus albus TaxID=2980026 RepID=A0A9E8RV25_9BACI|nr:hypothetical protein [Fervidibacillus albus]WAA10230.1 hypothetical protein OE104_02500 [Fervidibacillus albus]